MFEEILERVQYYKELGLNPLSLATGCAVKIDLIKVVYPALRKMRDRLRNLGLNIAPREDADIFRRTSEGVEIHRRIYRLGREADVDPEDIARVRPDRAITVVQCYQRYVDEPEGFIELLLPVYERIAESNVPISLGKGHSISTPFEDDQFALFDFLKLRGEKEDGYSAANNDTMHIIDPTYEPGDYVQVSGALSNTLNDLFVLGFHENIRIAPVLNAPKEELLDQMWRHAEEFARRLGAELIEVPQPERGRLLMGATVIADMDRHPPTFYDKARKGMKLVATRPFGELSPINVYLAMVIDDTIIPELEEAGIPVSEVERLKEDALKRISTPNINVAKVIYKFLPEDGADSSQHIIAATDVTGPGIYVVRELAESLNSSIKLWDIPVLYPKVSEYAAGNYVIPNATAGTNGAFILVVPDEIVEDVVRELEHAGEDPKVFGEITDVGRVEVSAPPKLRKYVADRKILGQFVIREEAHA